METNWVLTPVEVDGADMVKVLFEVPEV